MKKTLLLLIAFIALFNTVRAQTSGGPDAFGYLWRTNLDAQGPAYNWVDITTNPNAVLVTGLHDDNVVGPFSMTAPFHYYWYDVNSFYIGSNGYIAFDPGITIASTANGFPIIPDPAGVDNYLAAFLTDLTFDGAGNIGQCYYYQNADSVVISWVNVPFWQQPAPTWIGANSFQIILNRLDSSIVMQYETQNDAGPANGGNLCEVGIENISGAVGLEYLQGVYPSASTSVKYYYPPTTTFQVNDAGVAYCDNPTNGGIFLAQGGAPYYMTAGIKNAGNITLNALNVSAEILSSANVLQVRDTQTIASLNASATQVLSFGDPFIHNTVGSYTMNCNTLLAGDLTPSNNSNTLEIQVVDVSQTDIELGYDDGTVTATGLSWQGGGGGIANYFAPPFYPCNLTQVKEFIVSDASGVGYSMMVYDDDGVNGAPLTLLDSIFVAPGTFATGSYETTTLTAPIRIDSGGVYVLWFMGGADIQLGRNQTPPFSLRTYEVLGSSSAANFSSYRDAEVEDFAIHAVIQRVDIICADTLVSAGTNSANDYLMCVGDTVTFTSSGVWSPNTGSFSGIGWIISSADISGSADPLNDPSVIASSRFSVLPPSTSITKFVNDGALIGTTNPYGIYYWTPVVFGNASAAVPAPVNVDDLNLDTACLHTGNSVAVNIVGDQYPVAATTSNSPLLCDSLTLTINLSTDTIPGATYNWTGPNGFTSALPNPSVANATPADSGWYYITITSTNGCTGSDSVLFVVDTLAHTYISTSGVTTFCDGDSVTLTASSGSSYLWSPNNETTQAITVSTSGAYSAFVTAPNGCNGDAASAPLTVTVNPNPAVPVITMVNDSIINPVVGTAYHWYKNGVLQPSKTTKSIRVVASQNGSWYVIVENSFGCTSQSNTIQTTVGISELANSSDLKVYPNPSNGTFTIEIKSANNAKASIKILDFTGRIVLEENSILKNKFTINLNEKASGVYYLLLNDGNKVITRKLVVN